MSVMNLAIVGGVVLLVLLLVKMRRDKGGEKAPKSAKAPKGAKGRGRGRRRDKSTPPPPPEPMPLAAAAETVAPAEEPAPSWPGAALGEDDWPPAHAQEPVAAWPPPADAPADDQAFATEEFAADAPAGDPFAAEEPADEPAPAAPVADEPVPAPVAGPAWAEDEIVTDPGWPLPGEVDGGWSGAHEEPLVAAAGPAWQEQAAAAAPVEDVEWIGTEAAEDFSEEEIPQWTPPAADEAPAWQPPADEVPEWQAAEDEVPEWEAPAAPAAGPEAEVVAEEPQAWEPGPDIPSWEPPAADAEQPTGEFAAPAFEEPVFEEPVFEEPAIEEPVFEEASYEAPVFEEPVFDQPVAEEPAFAPVAEEPAFDAPVFEEPVFAEASFEAPSFEEPAVEEPSIDAVVVAESAPAVVEEEPAGEPVAWWDEEDPVAAPAGPPAEASSGRWALGGFAAQPGQHALGGVQFRQELSEAPAGWALAPAVDAGPGTLVLVLDGAINCDGGDVEVVTDPGFAPTPQGFTVRVAAKASGPFAASGTFHVL